LISGASNSSLDLSGITFTSTGLGSYTAAYSYSSGSLLVTFTAPASLGYYFDTNGSTSGVGISGGGTATWSASSTNWNPQSDGTGTTVALDPSQQAIFAGTAGTVNVSGTVGASKGVQFSTDSYVLQSGTLYLTGTSTDNSVTVDSGVTATVSTALAGTTGMTKAGVGGLTLNGDNSGLSGGITLSAGTLAIGSANALGSNAVTLTNGT